jgi:uncharacterized repeat protein (TIGR03847 family)
MDGETMSPHEIDFNPIDHITTDAIGQPGKRVFYIQAWQGNQNVTLIVEKFQIQSLAVGLEQFLGEIAQKFPELADASGEYTEDRMHIHPPVDPQFRVGDLALGYDEENDLVILIAHQAIPEGEDPEEATIIRFWCTRDQLRAMAMWGIEIASRGRPICPQCGEPMDPAGHFCPKRNGHLH